LSISLIHVGSALAADIGVGPVTMQLDAKTTRSRFMVTNAGTEPVVMQAEAVEWNHTDGADAQDILTSAIVVNPAVFTIQPGQTQLVRVGLRNPVLSPREVTYRLVMRELPGAIPEVDGSASGQVRVLLALRIPIYVAPTNTVRQEHWSAVRGQDGTVTANLQNDGNVHVRVERVQLKSADNEETKASDQAVAVLFAGEGRAFRLSGAALSAAGPATLEVTTDHGTQSVPVVVTER
jgi:fimbrial chaperone protein